MDIDIDVADRLSVLDKIQHVRALSSDEKTPHNVGFYVQDIPYNPILGTSIFPYKEAEELGFFKFDILNNSIYDGVKDEAHLTKLMADPPWEAFGYRNVVECLAHVHGHFDIVKQMKPKSVEELAMIIAMIRPAKRYLAGKRWTKIESEIWDKPEDDKYHFKKSHAIAYAMSIVVQLNLLIEQTNETI